jgi:hypothetical protein
MEVQVDRARDINTNLINEFDTLPNELILEIFKKLNFLSLINCQIVSKRFYQIATDSSIPLESYPVAFLNVIRASTCFKEFVNSLNLLSSDHVKDMNEEILIDDNPYWRPWSLVFLLDKQGLLKGFGEIKIVQELYLWNPREKKCIPQINTEKKIKNIIHCENFIEKYLKNERIVAIDWDILNSMPPSSTHHKRGELVKLTTPDSSTKSIEVEIKNLFLLISKGVNKILESKNALKFKATRAKVLADPEYSVAKLIKLGKSDP